jgi:hypothetical protein
MHQQETQTRPYYVAGSAGVWIMYSLYLGMAFNCELFWHRNLGHRYCAAVGRYLVTTLLVVTVVAVLACGLRGPTRPFAAGPLAVDPYGLSPLLPAGQQIIATPYGLVVVPSSGSPLGLPAADPYGDYGPLALDPTPPAWSPASVASPPLEQGLRLLLQFFGLTLAAHVVHRIHAWWRLGQDHSYYSGKPWLLSLLRFVFPATSERLVKRLLEPVLTLIAGFLVMPGSIPLGVYLMLAGTALCTRVSDDYRRLRDQALDVNDAGIDAERLHDHVQDLTQPKASRPAARGVAVTPSVSRLPSPPVRARQADAATPPKLAEGLDPALLQLLSERHAEPTHEHEQP